MAKVIKAYSLDLKTVNILENYCSASDNWDKKWSRSKVVNDAIVWYLEGDIAELVAAQENLMRKVRELAKLRDSPERTSLPWWRRLLLGR
jgi:hypothetical protein